LYPNVKGTALTEELVRTLIDEDRAMLLADGQPYYAVIVARPRLLGRRRAHRRYAELARR
ncbi:hypothetical protein ACSTLM_00400, partial [Vibrio parahaemolyticus]